MKNIKSILFLLLTVCLINCTQKKSAWKTLEIGRYQMDVPQDFDQQPVKGVDSAEGVIKSKNFSFHYDYGAYSDSLVASEQQYLQDGTWKLEAIIEPHNIKKLTPADWMLTKVISYRPATKQDSVLARGCDYVADCAIKERRFYFPVFIPLVIKNQAVRLDTIDKQRRRMVSLQPGKKGITGVYMRDVRGNVDNGFVYPGLHIIANNLDADDQDKALSILATLRPKRK